MFVFTDSRPYNNGTLEKDCNIAVETPFSKVLHSRLEHDDEMKEPIRVFFKTYQHFPVHICTIFTLEKDSIVAITLSRSSSSPTRGTDPTEEQISSPGRESLQQFVLLIALDGKFIFVPSTELRNY